MYPLTFKSTFGVLAGLFLLWSFSANPPQGQTGAPGESSCANLVCHSPNNLAIRGSTEIDGLPDRLDSMITYPLTIRLLVENGTPARGGFQMVVLDENNEVAGQLSNPGPSSTLSNFNNRTYFEHQPAQFFNVNDTIEYTVDWTSPNSQGPATAIFYLAANFANGNGSSNGDWILLTSDTVASIPDPLIAIVDLQSNTCYSGESYTVNLQVVGGRQPFNYHWSHGERTSSLVDLQPGMYTVTISDALGDSLIVEVEADSMREPILDIRDQVQLTLDGDVTVVELDLLDLLINSDPNCTETFSITFSQTEFDCDNMGDNLITVTVEDSSGLIATYPVTVHVLDLEPPILFCIEEEVLIGSCAPLSYALPEAIDNCSALPATLINGLGPNSIFPAGNNLEIYEVQDLAGNISRCTITIVNNPVIDLDVTIRHVSCTGENNGSINWVVNGPNPPYEVTAEGDFNLDSLGPGAYNLDIRDNSGCLFTRTVVIEEPDSLIISGIDITPATNGQVGDGQIRVHVSGGTPPYNFEWFTEDELFSTDTILNLLFPGSYLLRIRDSQGCEVATDSLRVDIITAVDEAIKGVQISLFPNPTANVFSLSNTKGGIEWGEILLLDYNGTKVPIRPLSKNSFAINHEVPMGIYFLKIRLKDGNFITKKLIIHHP